eukprot:3751409-Prymnesium_polylepis.1
MQGTRTNGRELREIFVQIVTCVLAPPCSLRTRLSHIAKRQSARRNADSTPRLQSGDAGFAAYLRQRHGVTVGSECRHALATDLAAHAGDHEADGRRGKWVEPRAAAHGADDADDGDEGAERVGAMM